MAGMLYLDDFVEYNTSFYHAMTAEKLYGCMEMKEIDKSVQ